MILSALNQNLPPVLLKTLDLVGPLGELWILLPIAVSLGIWCLISGERRGALAIVSVTIGVLSITVFLKLLSMLSTPILHPYWEYISNLFPSGHVAMGTVVYGALVICVSRSLPALTRTLGFIVVVLVVLLGIQRLVFDVHPILDVLGGAILGSMGLVVMVRLWPDGKLRLIGLPAIAIVVVVTLATFYGREVPSSQMIESASVRIHTVLDVVKSALPKS